MPFSPSLLTRFKMFALVSCGLPFFQPISYQSGCNRLNDWNEEDNEELENVEEQINHFPSPKSWS